MALYLVHFDRPFGHANHYLGFCDDERHDTEQAIETRLAYHRRGAGSKLLKAVGEAGIGFTLVRVWPKLGRRQERMLKAHSSTRLCPVCNASGWRGYANFSKERHVADVSG